MKCVCVCLRKFLGVNIKFILLLIKIKTTMMVLISVSD